VLKKLILPGLFVVLATLLFVGGPDYSSNRIFANSWDLGHVLLFFVLVTLLLRSPFLLDKSLAIRILVTLVIIMPFAVGIELVQLQTHRTSELSDIRRDLVGAFLGYLYVFRQSWFYNAMRLPMVAVALALCAFELTPLTRSLIDEVNIHRDKAALSNLEFAFEDQRWIGNSSRFVSEEFVREGESSLRVDLNTDEYSGVFLRYMNRDWREREKLHFSIYYPDNDNLLLHIRISDYLHVGNNSYHDRYNKEIVLRNGWNNVEIPIEDIKNAPRDRFIDIGNIESVGMFVVKQPETKTIYIDNVYLSQCCTRLFDTPIG